MDHIPEILAPAGGMEHLYAAVRCGANAVYMGAKNFNARRNAQNFSDEDMQNAVAYCHARNVKVYITLNTLITDAEISLLTDEISTLAHLGVDAVIVQDLGVAALVRHICPALPLHASTQMTIHNTQGALALESLGFSRVVLARELSANEIKTIAKSTKLELEVFVHGALCMSVSGQCYLSSMLGGRSGNRGLCAQPCRLDFKSNGRPYALSLKDLSLVNNMRELMASGVSALKIEGRMKRPEYVAASVTACKTALPGGSPDTDVLQAVFSRSGFTDGYFTAHRDIHMFGYRTREDVTAAAPVLQTLSSAYRDETPLVSVDMVLMMQPEEPASLEATDGMNTVCIEGPVPEKAIKLPLSAETARRSLDKTGGTPFWLRDFKSELHEGLTLSVSAINQMRKSALEQLLRKREAPSPYPYTKHIYPLTEHDRKQNQPEIRVRLQRFEQLSSGMIDNAAKIILPIEEILLHPELTSTLQNKLIGELPLMVFPASESSVNSKLLELKSLGLTDVSAGNLGSVHMAHSLGFTVHGDYALNILNSYALDAYARLGLADTLLSIEINMRYATALKTVLPRGIIVYGYLPLMTFRNCPAKGANGCGGCKGTNTIKDRLNKSFTIACRNREYSQLFNSQPLYLADKSSSFYGLDFITLYFTAEKPAICEQILQEYISHKPAEGEFTRGLYFRELK